MMNGNRYVDEVVLKYQPVIGPGTPIYEVGQRLRGLIQRWYSGYLERVHNSGSFAKGTSIRGGVDLDLFISLKLGTGKSRSIRAVKIWRSNRGIRFPSSYLELAVLRALQNEHPQAAATELTKVLEFLADGFVEAEFVDPANELNLISDDLTLAQKRAIANQAQSSLHNIGGGS